MQCVRAWYKKENLYSNISQTIVIFCNNVILKCIAEYSSIVVVELDDTELTPTRRFA